MILRCRHVFEKLFRLIKVKFATHRIFRNKSQIYILNSLYCAPLKSTYDFNNDKALIMLKMLHLRAALLSSLVFSSTSYAITIGEILNPTQEFLNCNTTTNPTAQYFCLEIQERINRELEQANLSIKDGGLLYEVNDTRDRTLSSSCSRRTELKNTNLKAHLLSEASIDLSGNALSKPALFTVDMPVKASARIDLNDRLGKKIRYVSGFPPRVKSKCIRVGSDSYYAIGSASLRASLVILFSLEPQFAVTPQGDFIIKIEPIIDVNAAIDGAVTKFDIRGASPLASLYSRINSINNAAFSGIEAILNASSVEGLLNDGLVSPIIETTTELTYGALLTDYALGNPAGFDKLVETFINIAVDKEVDKAQSEIDNITADLERQIAQALGLDSEGRAFYVFDANLAQQPVTQAHIDFIVPKKPVRSAQAGGRGGRAFNDYLDEPGLKISRVSIRSGSRVDAIQITYKRADGRTIVRPRRGGSGGRERSIYLADDEYIVSVSGVAPTSGRKANRIHRLDIKTSRGRSFSFGKGRGESFRFDNGNVVGFFGRSGRELDAIGVVAIEN